MPVVIDVADARTQAALDGVVIRSTGGTFFVPTMQSSIVGPPGATFGPLPVPEGSIGETDRNGRASMMISGQRPVTLRFFKEGYSTGFIVLQAGDDIVTGALAWTEGYVDPRVHVSLDDGLKMNEMGSRMLFRVRANANLTSSVDPS